MSNTHLHTAKRQKNDEAARQAKRKYYLKHKTPDSFFLQERRENYNPEEWKSLPRCNDYEVSIYGEVYYKGNVEGIPRRKSGICVQHTGRNGYKTVALNYNGKKVREYAHRLIAETWLTTLPTTNKKKLVLTQSYNPEKYPKYDNYDAIEVDRIKDIPYNYEGYMGCPITILGYDLENIEIIGMAAGAQDITGIPYTGNIPGPFIRGGNLCKSVYTLEDRLNCPVIDNKKIYKRIIIRKHI